MLKLGFFRAFSFGAADPMIQAYTGLKYQRDLSNVMVGAAPGFVLQNTQAILSPLVNNSEKTNTAEYNAARGLYNGFAAPAVNFGLAMLPGGPLGQIATGMGMAVASSPVAGDAVATALVGEKDRRGSKHQHPRVKHLRP